MKSDLLNNNNMNNDDDDDDDEDDSWLYESSGICGRRTTTSNPMTTTAETTTTELSKSSSSSSSLLLLSNNAKSVEAKIKSALTSSQNDQQQHELNQNDTKNVQQVNDDDRNNNKTNSNNNKTKKGERIISIQSQESSFESDRSEDDAHEEANKIIDTTMTLYEPDFKHYFVTTDTTALTKKEATTTTTNNNNNNSSSSSSSSYSPSFELPFCDILKWYVKYPSSTGGTGTKKRRRRQTIHVTNLSSSDTTLLNEVEENTTAATTTTTIHQASSKFVPTPIGPLPKQAYPCYIVTDPTKYPVGIDLKSSTGTTSATSKHNRSGNVVVVVRFLGYNNASWGQYLAVSEKSLLPFNYSIPTTYEWCPKIVKVFTQTIMQQKFFQENRVHNLQVETLVLQKFVSTLEQRYHHNQQQNHQQQQKQKMVLDTSMEDNDAEDSPRNETEGVSPENSNFMEDTKSTTLENITVSEQEIKSNRTVFDDCKTNDTTAETNSNNTASSSLNTVSVGASSPIVNDEKIYTNQSTTTSSIVPTDSNSLQFFGTPSTVRRSLRTRIAASAPPKQQYSQQQQQNPISVLRAGDIIQYHAPNQVVSRNTLREAAIINCYPNKKKSNDIVIETSLQDYLTTDDEIRITKRYLNGVVKDVNIGAGESSQKTSTTAAATTNQSLMLFRPVSSFTLKSEYNGKQFDHIGMTKQQALKNSYIQFMELQNKSYDVQ